MTRDSHPDDSVESNGRESAKASNETGAIGRLIRAFELILSAHASRAREEAGKDLSRMVSGGILLVLALFLVVPIVAMVDVAAALMLAARHGISMASALLYVALANAALAALLVMIARSRLSSPVLVETRATLKRAAVVFRGN